MQFGNTKNILTEFFYIVLTKLQTLKVIIIITPFNINVL